MQMCMQTRVSFKVTAILCVVAGGQATSSGGASGGEGVRVPPLMVEGKPHLPFQLQIEYTAQDGSRCMRVITQAKPITTNRDLAEKGMLGEHQE